MKTSNKSDYHEIYGESKSRVRYEKKDFIDYCLMIAITAVLVVVAYGLNHPIALAALVLCAYMVAIFPLRHGAKLAVPLLWSNKTEVIHLFVYKFKNARAPYFLAIGILLLENGLIRLTPDLPHYTENMRQIAYTLFFIHLGLITLYRTYILGQHLKKREHAKAVLLESSWRVQLLKQKNISIEIVHAYATGLLTHIVYLIPWYLVITYFQFSAIFLPVTIVIGFVIQMRFTKVINDWFYRDHWLCHNSEFEFVYNHGSHHDAIPSGLIGVAGNGFLEGFFRGSIGFPLPFLNPVLASLLYSADIKIDIDSHQYIPGIFPMLPKDVHAVTQHSLHHYGRLEPYGFGINMDQEDISEDTKKRFKMFPEELKNSISIEKELTNYEWNNRGHKWFLALIDKYGN